MRHKIKTKSLESVNYGKEEHNLSKKITMTKWEGMFGEEIPISKLLKPNEFLVLHIIALTQGFGGFSDITQKQMLDSLPIKSNKTLQSAIDGLVEFRYNGEPIILKTKKRGSNGKEQNVYQLLPNPLFAVYGEKPLSLTVEYTHNKEPLNVNSTHSLKSLSVNATGHNELLSVNATHTNVLKDSNVLKNLKECENKEEKDMSREMTSKEVISEFEEAMKTGMKKYKVVWGRDMKMAKAFLESVEDLKNFEKKRLIEIIVNNYEKWSSNSAKYPLQLSTLKIEWIQLKAREELKLELTSKSQIEEQNVEATKRTNVGVSSIMARIKERGGAK